MSGFRRYDRLSGGNEMERDPDRHARLLSGWPKEEAQELRLIFIASFAIFLLRALLARLMPWRWSGARAQPSILQEARAGALATMPASYFMG